MLFLVFGNQCGGREHFVAWLFGLGPTGLFWHQLVLLPGLVQPLVVLLAHPWLKQMDRLRALSGYGLLDTFKFVTKISIS